MFNIVARSGPLEGCQLHCSLSWLIGPGLPGQCLQAARQAPAVSPFCCSILPRHHYRTCMCPTMAPAVILMPKGTMGPRLRKACLKSLMEGSLSPPDPCHTSVPGSTPPHGAAHRITH
jgi:hypothetical protein